MTWPTVAVNTTNVDQTTDSPATARADLLDLIQKVNLMVAQVSTFMGGHLADANAAAARTTLGAAAAGALAASGITGAAASGANADISSMTGLANGGIPLAKVAGAAAASTTLAGYGITDGVNTTGAQTIAGKKSFSTPVDAASLGGSGTGNLTQYTTAVTPLPTLNGATLIASHGLGAVPASVELEITCLTAELGYSVGDVVNMPMFINSGATGWFNAPIWRNASQVGLSTMATIIWGLYNKTSGSSTASPLTAANWSYRFKVRAA